APAPFARQLAALEEKGGRPLTRGELAALRPATTLAPVRVIASRATGTVAADAATHRSGAFVAPSLAERERALQQSMLPAAAPRTNVPARPAPEMSDYAPPEAEPSLSAPAARSDRPPSAQQHAPPPRAVVPEGPGQAADSPPSMPVYQFPSAGAAPAPSVTTHSGETHRVPPPPPVPHTTTPVPPPPSVPHTVTPVPPPPSVPHTMTPVPPPPSVPHTMTPVPPPPPTAHPSSARTQSSEPRDSALHGDRDSRER